MAVRPIATTERSGRLGLPATTALVVGGIVGTGIFTLPAAIAVYG
jgi:APA family basic amino acid/polyamine antiporter